MTLVFVGGNGCTVGNLELIFNGAVQMQVVSPKRSEMYLSIDIEYVGVITKGGHMKNSEMLCT